MSRRVIERAKSERRMRERVGRRRFFSASIARSDEGAARQTLLVGRVLHLLFDGVGRHRADAQERIAEVTAGLAHKKKKQNTNAKRNSQASLVVTIATRHVALISSRQVRRSSHENGTSSAQNEQPTVNATAKSFC